MPLDAGALHGFLGIRETYQLPDALMSALLDDARREELLALVSGMACGETDPLRDYFQESHSNREAMMQDYTPDGVCELVARLAPEAGSALDLCAGTGSLSLFYADGSTDLVCEELSERAVPVLLLNLALRNLRTTVVERDVVACRSVRAYRVEPGERFGDVTECEVPGGRAFGLCLSNPPYSLKWSGEGSVERFLGYGVPPKSKADYVFVLDALSRLDEGGTAIFILPHGVLFRGASEGKIRAELIERNLIDAVIGLPDKLFANTGIPVCVMVLKKGRGARDVLFVDASKLFEKRGKANVLTDGHIARIVEAYSDRRPADKLADVASIEDIRGNGYNLNIPRYVDTFEYVEPPSLLDTMAELMDIDREIAETQGRIADGLSQLMGRAHGVGYQRDTAEFVRYLRGEAS